MAKLRFNNIGIYFFWFIFLKSRTRTFISLIRGLQISIFEAIGQETINFKMVSICFKFWHRFMFSDQREPLKSIVKAIDWFNNKEILNISSFNSDNRFVFCGLALTALPCWMATNALRQIRASSRVASTNLNNFENAKDPITREPRVSLDPEKVKYKLCLSSLEYLWLIRFKKNYKII